MSAEALPPTTELFTRRQLAERHPHLLNDHRLTWALRHRRTNGLSTVRAVYESPCGELLIHEPAFLAWFLGLVGRSKPRTLRKIETPTRSRAAGVSR